MVYLIVQLAIWLILTAAFAALAGWAFAAERAAPGEERARRERETLLRDLVRIGSDGGVAEDTDDPSSRLLHIRDARIAELERALDGARSRTDELVSQLAELRRGGEINDADTEELVRLRALAAEQTRTVDVDAEPVADAENGALQAWRLRYFEQRVKYLECLAQDGGEPPRAPAPETTETSLDTWRAREAEARANYLEQELRTVAAAPAGGSEARTNGDESDPFAANAGVDALLRWRLLYLERRVAHLQAAQTSAPAAERAPDTDRWKWRARYLEARVRHLEQRPAMPGLSEPAAASPSEPATPAPPPMPSRRAKPAVLAAARNGAPDDFTLIEGVSLLQQSTLYSLGVFHFDQLAAWTDENLAWVDQYLRLQGRIAEEEWVEQARDLARDGPSAARRTMEEEDA